MTTWYTAFPNKTVPQILSKTVLCLKPYFQLQINNTIQILFTFDSDLMIYFSEVLEKLYELLISWRYLVLPSSEHRPIMITEKMIYSYETT